MHLYQYNGRVIESDIAFPELSSTFKELAPDHRFRLASSTSAPLPTVVWSHQWLLLNGQTALHYGHYPHGHALRFPDATTFIISHHEHHIYCQITAKAPLTAVRHYLLDQVLPRLLSHQGQLMLHASASLLPDGAVLFLGDSGWGKSTLAAHFWQNGYPHIADDCLQLKGQADRYTVQPTYGGLRLWPDSVSHLELDGSALTAVSHYTTKKRVPITAEGTAHPLRAIFILAPPTPAANTISIKPLHPAQAVIQLIKQSYALNIADLEQHQQRFIALSQATATIPCYQLTYPRQHQQLPHVRQAILHTLS